VSVRILTGDCMTVLRTLPAESAQVVVTSPPYFALRSYLDADHPDKSREIGSEPTPDAFVATMVDVFREVRRVLHPSGVAIINLGDSYSGSGKGPTGHNGIGDQERRQGFTGVSKKTTLAGATEGSQLWQPTLVGAGKVPGLAEKNLLMIPFRVALALQADGWILRSVMPWVKRNSMPESVQDRPATAVEYLFLLSKSPRYYWDPEAIRQAYPESSLKRFESSPIQDVRSGSTKGMRQGGEFGLRDSPKRDDLKANPAGRSYRNSDPFFATWQGLMLDEAGDPLALVVNPQPNPLAHFASFPAGLVEPFVKAGTSEKGACPACGAPWRRVVERNGASKWAADDDIRDFNNDGRTANPQSSKSLHRQKGGVYSTAKTLGWQPSCSCDAGEPRPCVVLDPFLGSGTTCLVAERLGRDSIGVELSPTYAEMARARIYGDSPMFSQVELVS
jgi:hypothetical protein